MNTSNPGFINSISRTDTLQRLLYINIGVFVLVRVANSLSELFLSPLFSYFEVSSWLAVPASLHSLLLRPWTILTYMFYHWDFFHLLFNMLWLFWMGKIFQEYLGNKKLLSTYILGGICGAFFYILAYNLFPVFAEKLDLSFALGASAGVLAVVIGAATLVPDFPLHLFILGQVRLKWIAFAVVLFDLLNISGSNAGGHIAHLGGACFGFLYIRQLQKGNDIAAWFHRLTDKLRWKRRNKMHVHYRSQTASDENFLVNKKARQEKLDRILDKISHSGYGSLSTEEKEFLFKSSKEDS